MDPGREQLEFLTKQAMRKWDEALRNKMPPFFPRLEVGNSVRQFAQMPPDAELAMIRMKVAEQVLSDPDWDRKWWEPLRRNPDRPPAGFPNLLKVDYRWNLPARKAG